MSELKDKQLNEIAAGGENRDVEPDHDSAQEEKFKRNEGGGDSGGGGGGGTPIDGDNPNEGIGPG